VVSHVKFDIICQNLTNIILAMHSLSGHEFYVGLAGLRHSQ